MLYKLEAVFAVHNPGLSACIPGRMMTSTWAVLFQGLPSHGYFKHAYKWHRLAITPQHITPSESKLFPSARIHYLAMPGGKRNPLSMTRMIETIEDVVQTAKTKAESKVAHATAELSSETKFVDLSIQFIGASGLPKMDVVGTADPYFIAKIDKRTSFVSKVIRNTLSPVWNEPWRVRNVPTSAILHITVMDKDEGAMTDDYIGEFETSISEGAKEAEIIGPMFRRDRGTFWLKIDSTHTRDKDTARQYPYLFDGPIRYSKHFSPTVGLLTNLDQARLYSTWKMYVRGIPLFFGDKHQHWNRNYKAAQNIFQGPTSVAVRSGIQAGHRMLYARTSANGFGIIDKPTDVIEILHGGAGRPGSKNASIQMQHAKRVKPAVYTYIISSDDDSFRFSETGAAFFVDFASKHALHSNCNETVRYSGEFHPRPQGGWQNFSDEIPDEVVEWELVIDNNSGTYAPDKTLLPVLRRLLEYNFPGFTIHAWDREDPRLKESVDACREYSTKYRGVGTDELQPTANEGEETLMHHVSLSAGKKQDENGGDAGQGGETGHGGTGSNASTSSVGPSGGGYSYGQPPHPQYGQPAYSPYHADSSNDNSSGVAPAQPKYQQPPPLAALPRTSSEFILGSVNGAPPPFPEPTQYVPPTTQGQFVPLANASYGYTPMVNPPTDLPNHSHEPPASLRPGSRPASRDYSTLPPRDYSALPPGAAPPATRNHGSIPAGDGSQGHQPPMSGQGAYGGAMMSRYDPHRR